MTEKSFVTIAELSRTSGLSDSTIRRLVRDKRIPFVQPSGKGGKLLFPPDAIERSAQTHSENQASELPLAGRRPSWMNQS
jgi:excisionase family DNA binding protein